MKKVDLEDLTFLIPVRLDSMIRLENLLAVVAYIQKHFRAHVMVWEASYYNRHVLDHLLPKNIEYNFVEDKDPIFYRTYYLNQMTLRVHTEFMALWDADVLAPPAQVIQSMEMLRNQDTEVVFPYDGNFMEVSELLRIRYLSTQQIKSLTHNIGKMNCLYTGPQSGGAVLINVEKYKQSGMENERYYGWAPEDWERVLRWKNLGYRIDRIPGPLFHLTHPRDHNGRYNSTEIIKATDHEASIIRNSSAKEINTHFEKQKKKYNLL